MKSVMKLKIFITIIFCLFFIPISINWFNVFIGHTPSSNAKFIFGMMLNIGIVLLFVLTVKVWSKEYVLEVTKK